MWLPVSKVCSGLPFSHHHDPAELVAIHAEPATPSKTQRAGCYENGVGGITHHSVLCESEGATKDACDAEGKMWLEVSRKCR